MLKNVRHISEGNFYGLRVTNNAKNVSLDKKLRTLEACKDAQDHCYRKEEKDLINTLSRLQKSKEHSHHTDKLVRRHVDGEHHDDHKHHARKLRNGSSSSASLVVPLTPVASATILNISTKRHENPLSMSMETAPGMHRHISTQMHENPAPISMETGSVIHRTTGFIDCVICRLPRHSHVKGTDVCRCDKGPDKGTHHMHPPALHEDRKKPEYLDAKEKKELHVKTHPREHDEKEVRSRWSRRGSIEKDEQMFLEKLQREMHHAIEAPLQLNQENGYEKLSHSRHDIDKGHVNQRHRINSVLEDERHRTRQDSIMEEGQYVMPRGQRRMSNEMYDPRKRQDSSGAESYYSVGEIKSRSSSIEDQRFHRTFSISHSSQYPPSPPQEKHSSHTLRRFSFHDDSHLPTIASPHEGGNTEAFHGLIHPDNIINHHHYLPYEADKPRKHHHHDSQRGNYHDDRHHDDHGRHHDDHGRHHDDHGRHQGDHHHQDKRHLHGYYIHKYDHVGTRQIAHIPLGSNSHMAEMLYKQHEPESNHYSLLSNLRQLLSVYKRLDETMPRYPWPTPPSTDMSVEEFQKLKDCRYLRLPKCMEETTVDSLSSPIFH